MLVGLVDEQRRAELVVAGRAWRQDVEERVSAAHRALDQRGAQEERALGAVNEELKAMKSTKANHEELVRLVITYWAHVGFY